MLQQYGQTRSPAVRRLYFARPRKSGGTVIRRAQSRSIRAGIVIVSSLVFGLMLGIAGSSAQSGSLYGAGAPEDAAFVRVFNSRSDGTVPRLWVGATEFRNLAMGESSAYRPVTPEIHMVYLNDAFEELIAREGAYYTILLRDDGLLIHEDPAHRRADLAQILVYNLDIEERVALRSADGTTTVVGELGSGESGAVAVNPVAVELGVFLANELYLELGDIGLERGQSFAVFVMDNNGRPTARVDRAEILVE